MKNLKNYDWLFTIAIALMLFFMYVNNNSNKQEIKKLEKSIELLEKQRDSLKKKHKELNIKLDSLHSEKNKIDTVYEPKIKYYEKEYNNIVNQFIDADILFFSNYLSKDSIDTPRFNNHDNFPAVKTD